MCEGKPRVLLVEDDPAVGKTVVLGLKIEGWDVDWVTDGFEALNRIRESRPDLIVLDIMLPHIDGFRICRMVKFDKKTSRVPIILCSARDSEADREKGRRAGGSTFLAKPFEVPELVDHIKALLPEKAGRGMATG